MVRETATVASSFSSSAASAKITPDRIRILVRRVEHGSPMLEVLHKVFQAINTNCDPKRLTDIISSSPELSMKVVRVANSAAFGSRRPESVRQAVELLGWQRIADIIMTVGMKEQAEEVEEGKHWDAAAYQRRSVATAFVSQLLAKRVEPWNDEKYYMCGLFQEWGLLLMAKFAAAHLETIGAVLSKTAVESPTEVEQFYIGTDHAELGAIAAEEYRMPPEVIASIRHHHSPADAPDEFQVAADIAHVASWVVGELGIYVVPCIKNHVLDKFALLRLGWSPEDVDVMRRSILGATQSVADALEK